MRSRRPGVVGKGQTAPPRTSTRPPHPLVPTEREALPHSPIRSATFIRIFTTTDHNDKRLSSLASPVILSAAKDLSSHHNRSFAALRMTFPIRSSGNSYLLTPVAKIGHDLFS